MVQQGYKLAPRGRKTASGPSVIYLKMDSSIQKKVPLVSIIVIVIFTKAGIPQSKGVSHTNLIN